MVQTPNTNGTISFTRGTRPGMKNCSTCRTTEKSFKFLVSFRLLEVFHHLQNLFRASWNNLKLPRNTWTGGTGRKTLQRGLDFPSQSMKASQGKKRTAHLQQHTWPEHTATVTWAGISGRVSASCCSNNKQEQKSPAHPHLLRCVSVNTVNQSCWAGWSSPIADRFS